MREIDHSSVEQLPTARKATGLTAVLIAALNGIFLLPALYDVLWNVRGDMVSALLVLFLVVPLLIATGIAIVRAFISPNAKAGFLATAILLLILQGLLVGVFWLRPDYNHPGGGF